MSGRGPAANKNIAIDWTIICISFAWRVFPSLHHGKEGRLRHQENIAKPPKLTQPGWFSFYSHRYTTPASRTMDASRYSFDRSATPPRGGARRGMSLDSNSFQAPYTAATVRLKR